MKTRGYERSACGGDCDGEGVVLCLETMEWGILVKYDNLSANV